MANKIVRLTDGNGDTILPIGFSQGGTKMDLLWTNPSPTSEFAAQTITLDLSNYSMILVEIRYNATASDNQFASSVSVIGTQSTTIVTYSGSSSSTFRKYTSSTTGVTFENGYIFGVGTSYSQMAIPYKIYGIKTAWIVPTTVNGLQYVEVE